jgi:hypothetical protein
VSRYDALALRLVEAAESLRKAREEWAAMELTVQTRELLADTRGYGRRVASGQMLTHSVLVDAEGRDQRVLCRVKLENIADSGAGDAASLAARPTCRTCARRDPRFE